MSTWLNRLVRRAARAEPAGTDSARGAAGVSCFLHLAIGRPACPVMKWCEDFHFMVRGLALITVAPPAGASAAMLEVIRQQVAPGQQLLSYPDGFIGGWVGQDLHSQLCPANRSTAAAENDAAARGYGSTVTMEILRRRRRRRHAELVEELRAAMALLKWLTVEPVTARGRELAEAVIDRATLVSVTRSGFRIVFETDRLLGRREEVAPAPGTPGGEERSADEWRDWLYGMSMAPEERARAVRYLRARLPAELEHRIRAARNERGERWSGPESRGIGLEVRALLQEGRFWRPSLSLNHVWVELVEATLDERR
jgi:hypothetical protein